MGLANDIEVLATITGVDEVSSVLARVDGSFDKLSETAQAAAAAAEEAAARIDASLLSTASGEDAVTLASAQVEGARTTLAAATAKQAAAERGLVTAQQESLDAADGDTAAQTKLIAASKTLADAQKTAATAATELEGAQARLAATIDATTGASITAAREQAIASDEQAAAAEKAGDASAEASSKVKTAAFVAAAVVAGIGYEAVKSAMNFQTLTTRLVTTAGESTTALNSVRSGILQISDQTGVSASSLASSMYVVESAGYHAANGGMDVLKAATEGAATEGADFSNVANAVTDILKDYHLAGSDAANVTSQLTTAVSVGKANFQTMSSAMSNVLPLASAVGLKFSDVAGTLAEMTSHGVTAQRASQNLATAIRSLEKPNAAMLAEFKAVGISTAELNQHMSSQGLGGTLEWLSQTASKEAPKLKQTYSGALGSLVGTAAGLNVALEVTGKNAKDTAKDIVAVGKSSADANGDVKGFAALQQTAGFQLDRAKTAIENVGITLGTVLLPMVTKAAKDIAAFISPIAAWINKHKQLTVTIFEVAAGLLALVGAIKIVTAVTEIWEGVMDLIEDSPWVAAITAIVLILIYCYTHFKTFRDIVNEVMSAVKVAVEATVSALITAFNSVVSASIDVWHGLVTAWDAIAGAAKEVWGALTVAWNAVASVTSEVWDGIADFFKKWWPLLLFIFATPIAVLLSIWVHFHTQIEAFAKATWNAISGFFVTNWHLILSAAKTVWTGIQQAIIQPIEHAWQVLQPLINFMLSSITYNWNKLVTAAKFIWGEIKTCITQPLEQAWNWLMNWVNKFTAFGNAIVEGIIKGIGEGAGGLFSSLKHLANDALGAAKSAIESGSPSKLFAREVGAPIPQGIALGVTTNASLAHNAVRQMSTGLVATAKTSLSAQFTAGGGFNVNPAGSGSSSGSQTQITLDMRGSQIMSDQDMDKLSQKIQKRLATVILPSGGYRSRF